MKWLAISDIHIGTPHIHPQTTYSRVWNTICPWLSKIDLLTIGGDFYDNAFYLDDAASLYGNLLLQDILDASRKYKFAVRVIRGTYSHDRDQLDIVEVFSKRYGKDINIAYYKHLMIDEVKGYKFLYLPDNLPYKISELMSTIIPKSLREYGEYSGTGSTTVDCILGHGYFKHVLPEALIMGKYVEAYDANVMKDYVDNIIVMGHVHTSSSHQDLVYYTGSFDRDRHGEEEPKGCLLIDLDKNNHTVTFLPNEQATPHLTVTLTKGTIEDGIKEIKDFILDKFTGGTPVGYLRISGGELRSSVRSIIQNEYPTLVVTDVDKTSNKQLKSKTKLDFTFKNYSVDIPTKDNLPNLLHDYLSSTMDDFPLSVVELSQGLLELEQRG